MQKPPPEIADAFARGDFSGVADLLLGVILAAFMAFATGVLTWRYGRPDSGYRYGFLPLLGVLLLCYWAVLAARRLWRSK
jgi:hypothetical protein